jgi:hypothetical protein
MCEEAWRGRGFVAPHFALLDIALLDIAPLDEGATAMHVPAPKLP